MAFGSGDYYGSRNDDVSGVSSRDEWWCGSPSATSLQKRITKFGATGDDGLIRLGLNGEAGEPGEAELTGESGITGRQLCPGEA